MPPRQVEAARAPRHPRSRTLISSRRAQGRGEGSGGAWCTAPTQLQAWWWSCRVGGAGRGPSSGAVRLGSQGMETCMLLRHGPSTEQCLVWVRALTVEVHVLALRLEVHVLGPCCSSVPAAPTLGACLGLISPRALLAPSKPLRPRTVSSNQLLTIKTARPAGCSPILSSLGVAAAAAHQRHLPDQPPPP